MTHRKTRQQGAICYNILCLDSRSEHNWNSYVWLLSRQYIHSTAAQLAQTGWILRPMVPFTDYNRTKRSRRGCYRYTSRFVLSYQDASGRLTRSQMTWTSRRAKQNCFITCIIRDFRTLFFCCVSSSQRNCGQNVIQSKMASAQYVSWQLSATTVAIAVDSEAYLGGGQRKSTDALRSDKKV